MTDDQLAAEIKQRSRQLGFDKCGIAQAGPSGQATFLREWLAEGRHAGMEWLAKRTDERADIREYLPGAQSVICVAMSYHVPLAEPAEGQTGKVARYALSGDYHKHMKKRLHALADWLRVETKCETKACVDTAPVLEREWAARAGIGWQGKNTLVMDTKLGSYLLLGEVVTTLTLPPDRPAVDRCGTCTRCIEACPTNAITPYALDPRKCISYWTIEDRGETLGVDPHGWLFGCDICQEVCPWNRKALPATDPHAQPKPHLAAGRLDPREVLDWSPEQYQDVTRGTALKRVKLPQWKRNAAAVLDHTKRAPQRSAGEPVANDKPGM